jgi:hypothetical protein
MEPSAGKGGCRGVGVATRRHDRLEGRALQLLPEKKGIGMRVRFFTILTALALAVAVVASFGTGAGARPSAKPSAVGHAKVGASPAHIAGTIYGQRDNDNGVGIVSQNFTDAGGALDIYDNQGADNFKIQNKGIVKKVIVDGIYFNGPGPAESIHVTFYKNAGTSTGSVVKDVPAASYTDSTGTGTFTVSIPKTTLKAGKYWVSVYVNMAFNSGATGEWGWLTNNTVRGAPSVWQNPGNGFSTGCTTYQVTTTCIPSGEGGDFSFALVGKGH